MYVVQSTTFAFDYIVQRDLQIVAIVSSEHIVCAQAYAMRKTWKPNGLT